MPTIPSGMQWVTARLLQAPVTLLQTLLCPIGPKPLQDFPWHPGPGSRNWDFLLVFPAQSWNNVRVMEQAGGLNKHKAKAGCPRVWEEVAQGGTEAARTALKGSRLEGAEFPPRFMEPARNV